MASSILGYITTIEDVTPIYIREVAVFQYKFLDKIMSNKTALIP